MDDKQKKSENEAGASIKKIFGEKKSSPGQSSVSISGSSSGSSSSRGFTTSTYSSFRRLDSPSRQNAISLAEQNVRAAEERVRRTKQNLQAVRDLRFKTVSNFDRISADKSMRDMSTSASQRLMDYARNSEAFADRSVSTAEQHVARAEQDLRNAQSMLAAAKRK